MMNRHNSTLRNLRGASDKPAKPEQAKEFSILIRRRGYIDKAANEGYKSILIQPPKSGIHPVLLK